MKESCHTFECVMLHMEIRNAKYFTTRARHADEQHELEKELNCVTHATYTGMNHFTLTNCSCHTYE